MRISVDVRGVGGGGAQRRAERLKQSLSAQLMARGAGQRSQADTRRRRASGLANDPNAAGAPVSFDGETGGGNGR